MSDDLDPQSHRRKLRDLAPSPGTGIESQLNLCVDAAKIRPYLKPVFARFLLPRLEGQRRLRELFWELRYGPAPGSDGSSFTARSGGLRQALRRLTTAFRDSLRDASRSPDFNEPLRQFYADFADAVTDALKTNARPNGPAEPSPAVALTAAPASDPEAGDDEPKEYGSHSRHDTPLDCAELWEGMSLFVRDCYDEPVAPADIRRGPSSSLPRPTVLHGAADNPTNDQDRASSSERTEGLRVVLDPWQGIVGVRGLPRIQRELATRSGWPNSAEPQTNRLLRSVASAGKRHESRLAPLRRREG